MGSAREPVTGPDEPGGDIQLLEEGVRAADTGVPVPASVRAVDQESGRGLFELLLQRDTGA
jgi:hypothetical protein